MLLAMPLLRNLLWMSPTCFVEQHAIYADHKEKIDQQPSQKQLLELVVRAIDNDEQMFIFIDAPAGCGKTYCEEAILAYVRSKGHVALAVASTGVAALLLEGCSTAHSKLKIPIDLDEKSVLGIHAQKDRGELMRRARLLIWDEAVMTHRHALECVERSLRDLRGTQSEDGAEEEEKPFGKESDSTRHAWRRP